MDWDSDLKKATFSAGKFWGVQFYFDQIPGVIRSRVGYTGGTTENPTKEQVEAGSTGHTEAVELEYDTDLVSYNTLLEHFFRIHDPTLQTGSGKMIGNQFKSVIYVHDDMQKNSAEEMLKNITAKYKALLTTQIKEASAFYEASPEDQKYTQNTGEGMEHVPHESL